MFSNRDEAVPYQLIAPSGERGGVSAPSGEDEIASNPTGDDAARIDTLFQQMTTGKLSSVDAGRYLLQSNTTDVSEVSPAGRRPSGDGLDSLAAAANGLSDPLSNPPASNDATTGHRHANPPPSNSTNGNAGAANALAGVGSAVGGSSTPNAGGGGGNSGGGGGSSGAANLLNALGVRGAFDNPALTAGASQAPASGAVPPVLTAAASSQAAQANSQTILPISFFAAPHIHKSGGLTPGGDPPIPFTEGIYSSQVVATFTDSDGNTDPAQYTASINYGDGQSEDGMVEYVNGQFQVSVGEHVYTEAGSFPITVTINDSDGDQTIANATAAVADAPLNWQSGYFAPNYPPYWGQTFEAAPSITAPYSQTNTEGQSVNLQVQASDSDGDGLSYDALDLPPGLSISSSGLITGTVANGAAVDFGGSYNPIVIVDDGKGGSAQTNFSWTINQAQVDPVLTSPGDQTNLRGDTVSLQLSATQADNDPITYDASNLPTGLSIDPESGLISGTVDPSATLNVPYAVTVTATDDDTSLDASQNFNWTINATNVAPVLTSPGDQTNAAGDVVSLQLSASDADGDTPTYTATGLPSGLTLDPITGLISGTLPNSAASSTPYSVTVTASDGMSSSSQTFNWTVNAISLQSPGDQSNLDGDTVSLQLTATDASNGTLTYSATGLPPGLSIDSGSGLISGTISNTADGGSPYSVTVTAGDGTNSASQTFNWTVAGVALNPPGDQENQEGASVSLQLSATDNVGTPTYSATGLPTGLTISSTGLISGTIGTAAHGSSPYQVTVTATDGSSTSSQSFVWSVTPRVALVNAGPQSSATGDSVSLQLSATSPGGTMTYAASGLPSGLSINSSTGLISGTIASGAASSTPYNVTVTASDGTSTSSQTFQWTVSVINVVSPGDQANIDGDTVSLPLTTSYHGSGPLNYSADGLPSGLSINSSTGEITGTISSTADTNSPYQVTITGSDESNSTSVAFNWTVNPLVSVDPIDDQSNAAGDVVSLQVSADDADSKTLNYSASGLPSGLSISSTTGLISGTIAAGAVSTTPYSVTVTVSDGTASATQTFNWMVASVVNVGSQASVDGQAVSLALGSGISGVTYSATGLPPGLSISSTTGLVSGTIGSTADTSSPYVVTVTASDGTSQTFLWTVTQVGLAAVSDQTNTEGDSVSLQLQGLSSGGTLNYSASGLPDGLSISGTGLISGTIAPGAAANGPFTVDVSVSNGSTSASQSFTWTVNPVVNLTAPADQSNNEGDTVSLQMAATDSKGGTLAYSADGLPSGLSISSTGLISGNIATGDAANGPYAVTVTASDGTYSSSVTFNWNVTHTDTTSLTMTNPGTQTNVTGDSVNVQVNASDPDGIDQLTYSATGLPDGLDIDPFSGIISGTMADDAATPTPYQVTVTATDGNGQSVSQSFNWIVNASPLTAQASAVSAVEGQDTGSITVASFTTADLNSQAGDFTATVDWGDGSTPDVAEVDGSNGSFTVTDEHVYDTPGSYPVTVTIVDTVTGATSSATSTATVTDAPLTMTGGLELGDPMTNPVTYFTVAYFTDGNPDASPYDFTANINWGDGNSGAGVVTSLGDGLFSISGTHSYPNPANQYLPGPVSYGVSVTVTDKYGASGSTSSTIVVGLIAAGVSAQMSGWQFDDANPNATASDFVSGSQSGVVSVDWGDNSTSTGPVGGPNGYRSVYFEPSGTHVYTQDSLDQPGGQYAVAMNVTDADGSTLSGTQYVSVTRPPVNGLGDNVEGQPGVGLSNLQVAEFTEPGTLDGLGEFSATIDWGDGTTPSSGTIQELAPGQYVVLGSHTYGIQGFYTTKVSISQDWQNSEEVLVVPAKAQIGNAPDVMLNSIAFLKGTGLQNDLNAVPFGRNQWLDKNLNGVIDKGNGDQQFPYSYVNGSIVTLAPVFRPQGNLAGKNAPESIQVKGAIYAGGPEGFVIPLTTLTLQLDGKTGAYGDGQIPNVVKGKIEIPQWVEASPFTIYWQYSANNGPWKPAGVSRNKIYITYKPIALRGANLPPVRFQNKLETVFAYGSSSVEAFSARPSSNPQVLMNIIWSNFAQRSAQRASDGKPLYYYGNPWLKAETSYTGLVTKQNGQCGSWASLLGVSMLAQGLNQVEGWSIKWVTVNPTPGSKYDGFFVKNWAFTNKNGDNINFGAINLGASRYDWTKGKDVQAKKLEGIPAQNQPNPLAIFNNHVMVELVTPDGVSLYDPSFGNIYHGKELNDALLAFQKAAIAGFFKSEGVVIGGNKVTKYTITPITADAKLQVREDTENSYDLK